MCVRIIHLSANVCTPANVVHLHIVIKYYYYYYYIYIVIVYRLMFWSRRIVYYYYDYRSRPAASLFIFRIIINSYADDFVFCIAGTIIIRIFNVYLLNIIITVILVYCATYALSCGGALSRAACVMYSRRETQNALRRPIEVRISIKKKNCHRVYLQILIIGIRIYHLCSPCLRAEHLNY